MFPTWLQQYCITIGFRMGKTTHSRLIKGVFPFVFCFQLMLSWVAVSFWLVTSTYFLNTGWIFRKRQDGSFSAYPRWFCISVFLIVEIYKLWSIRNETLPPELSKGSASAYIHCDHQPDRGRRRNGFRTSGPGRRGAGVQEKIDHRHLNL